MSNLDRSIVSIIEPALKVDALVGQDAFSKEANEKKNPVPGGDDQTSMTAREGSFSPLIYINTTKFEESEILRFEIDCYGKIPKASFTIKDNQRKMNVDGPLDGDVISVYLRPPDSKNQRPIRIDFDVTSSSPNGQMIFDFEGIMKVPGLKAELNKGFSSDTSFNHLQDVAEYLQIGFASNETSTDDAQVRMCAYEPIENFIQETVDTCYKDDDSFFDWFIDPYYYLNFVNVNKQFDLEEGSEKVNASSPFMNSMYGGKDNEDSIKADLVLTNRTDRKGTNMYLVNFAVQSNSANVALKEGYKRYVQYYNVGDGTAKGEYVKNFVDPLTTKGAEDKMILMKGRRDEETYKKQVKYKWLGKMSGGADGGNMHDNAIFAEVLNHQNRKEITKQSLEVELESMNFYLYKYMRVPVLIYQQADNKSSFLALDKRDEALGEAKPNENSTTIDGSNDTPRQNNGNSQSEIGKVGDDMRDAIRNEFLSGYYVISGIKYEWTYPGPINQKMTLLRREWPIPGKNKNY